jgi:hypothetical protein
MVAAHREMMNFTTLDPGGRYYDKLEPEVTALKKCTLTFAEKEKTL